MGLFELKSMLWPLMSVTFSNISFVDVKARITNSIGKKKTFSYLLEKVEMTRSINEDDSQDSSSSSRIERQRFNKKPTPNFSGVVTSQEFEFKQDENPKVDTVSAMIGGVQGTSLDEKLLVHSVLFDLFFASWGISSFNICFLFLYSGIAFDAHFTMPIFF